MHLCFIVNPIHWHIEDNSSRNLPEFTATCIPSSQVMTQQQQQHDETRWISEENKGHAGAAVRDQRIQKRWFLSCLQRNETDSYAVTICSVLLFLFFLSFLSDVVTPVHPVSASIPRVVKQTMTLLTFLRSFYTILEEKNVYILLRLESSAVFPCVCLLSSYRLIFCPLSF